MILIEVNVRYRKEEDIQDDDVTKLLFTENEDELDDEEIIQIFFSHQSINSSMNSLSFFRHIHVSSSCCFFRKSKLFVK
jgi:hypothetical protein